MPTLRFTEPRSTALAAALALALLALSKATQAATAAPAEADDASFDRLDRIVVAATLTESALASLPSVISAIDRAQLQRELAMNLRDAVRYEPGVSVRSSFGRFGLGDFRIRGLEGNRVLIETDGIAVSDAFAIGSFSSAGRISVDPATLKTIEIVRGPGSSLYGSDALGGVVALQTVDAEDLVREGEDRGLALRMGYSGEDSGAFGGTSAAFVGERWSGLAVLHRREGREPRNQGEDASDGAARTRSNPQDSAQSSLLTKLGFAPHADQRWTLTVEGNEGRALTDVRSARTTTSGFGLPVRVLDLQGDDRQTRARVSLRHAWSELHSTVADSLRWQIYRQDSETTQRTFEERVSLAATGPINPTRREREFNFDQRVHGAEFTAHKSLALGNWRHRFTWGLDLSVSDIRQKRDGRSINLSTDAISTTISPDAFPVRDFPVSRTTAAGLYLQDEIETAEGVWRLIPGLRIDHYALDPEQDAIFAADNPGVALSDVRETAVSPKFGLVRRLGERYSAFAGYARGFRSPPYNDVNLGFTNLQFGYTAIPNPDLKPETSDGIELGLRRHDADFWWTLSGYANRYRDFIESLRSLGVDPATGLLVFQSQNVSRARIHGVELKGGWALGSVWPALDNVELRFAAAQSKGRDTTADRPLASVDPLNAVLGLRWSGSRSSIELALRGADRKREPGTVTGTGGEVPAFAAPGYGVFDLLYELEFARHARLNVGVFNLADRKYWDWAAVPQVAASSAVLDRYSAPGRYLSAQLELSF
jgi:hemoglobin/transferrin/lactoferrin receptor protein